VLTSHRTAARLLTPVKDGHQGHRSGGHYNKDVLDDGCLMGGGVTEIRGADVAGNGTRTNGGYASQAFSLRYTI